MTGYAGKVALQVLVTHADVLEADGALARLELDDAVDEQERIAVRDERLDLRRVQLSHQAPSWRARSRKSVAT